MKKTLLFLTLILASVHILAACENDDYQRSGNEGHNESDADQDYPPPDGEIVEVFMHIHGLAYYPKDPYDLYISTHHGVIRGIADDEWYWVGEDDQRHDLMGFDIMADGKMISSGHPAQTSHLKDPIGIITSEDRGRNWTPISLHGEVDFHVFEVNIGDPSYQYGFDWANSILYRSEDGGYTWIDTEAEDIPLDEHSFFALFSHVEDPHILLAGTDRGILKSDDSGATWTVFDHDLSFVSAQGTTGDPNQIVAYLLGENRGLKMSDDFGQTWTSLGLERDDDDVVFHIAFHPDHDDVLTVGTQKENIYHTTDWGETWTTLAEEGVPVR